MTLFELLSRFLEDNRTILNGLSALNAVVQLVLVAVGLTFLASTRGKWRLSGIGPLKVEWQAIQELKQFQASYGKTFADASGIEKAVRRATEPAIADQLAGKSILWVDDHPENNRSAVRALTRLKLHVETAISTDDALRYLDRIPDVDLVISDMGRGSNMRAGYELLEAVRQRGLAVPFAIFAGSNNQEFRREAAARNAQLSTNDVGELLTFIIKTLTH